MKAQKKQQRSMHAIATGRWTAYMAAAAASTFAGAGSAEAEIHYSGDVSIKLTGYAKAGLPLSNGASLAFEAVGGSTFWQDFLFFIKGVTSGSVRGYARGGSGRNFVTNLGSGENVSAGRFVAVTGHLGYGILFSNWSSGQFAPDGLPVRGFVGFRFNTGNGMQYGWARIETMSHRGNRIRTSDLIKNYAWGDPGDVILTGQTQSLQAANANSVAGSLGLLAFGAQGLDAWRAQRAQKSD
ncbi:MAG TPA: hypothetical protein VH207_12720 [Chthoniobacterales bacterium]|jgi:hypothetical protein|nr:hypothetical protein [Chthoniobacterales bacterium]